MGSNNKKSQIITELPLWAKTGHAKPITRRDFLSGTIGSFTTVMALPSLLSVLLRDQALAAQLNCAPALNLIPFITVNLSGGAAMAANFVPHDKGSQPLTNYDVLGLGNKTPPLEIEFGKAPFAGKDSTGNIISKFLVGIRAKASAAALGNTAFVGMPVQSRDDSAENKFDISGLVSMAGLSGELLPNLGTEGTATGIRQQSAGIAPPSPLIVNNFKTLVNSLGYAAQINQPNMNAKIKLRMANLIKNLNSSQARKLASFSGGENVKNIIECANIKAADVVSLSSDVIDPRKNGAISTLWGITATTDTGDQIQQSSIVYNALLGNAASAGISLGGYDYHDNTRTTGNRQDQAAGELIGKILESAQILGKPVFIYVTSDGAISSNKSAEPGAATWSSDRGNGSCAYMLYFNPSGRPETSSFQLGAFTSGQVADTSFPSGASPEAAGFAAFANYLQINKQISQLNTLLPRKFSTELLKSTLIFA